MTRSSKKRVEADIGLIEAAVAALPADSEMTAETAVLGMRLALAFGPTNELARAMPASGRQTIAQLKNIELLSNELGKAISMTRQPAWEAIKAQKSVNLSQIFEQLHLLYYAAFGARKALPSKIRDAKNPGRPPKKSAEQIALVAKSIFEEFTGRDATVTTDQSGKRRGVFVEFLTRIFEAGKVDADPATFAVKVTRVAKVSDSQQKNSTLVLSPRCQVI